MKDKIKSDKIKEKEEKNKEEEMSLKKKRVEKIDKLMTKKDSFDDLGVRNSRNKSLKAGEQ
jgi:hypothetical protein